MADHTVAASARGAHGKTLTAGQADKVTFEGDVDRFEVVWDGSAAGGFTVNAPAPASATDSNAHYLPAFACVREVEAPANEPLVVRLLSAGTPTYSVARLD